MQENIFWNSPSQLDTTTLLYLCVHILYFLLCLIKISIACILKRYRRWNQVIMVLMNYLQPVGCINFDNFMTAKDFGLGNSFFLSSFCSKASRMQHKNIFVSASTIEIYLIQPLDTGMKLHSRILRMYMQLLLLGLIYFLSPPPPHSQRILVRSILSSSLRSRDLSVVRSVISEQKNITYQSINQ